MNKLLVGDISGRLAQESFEFEPLRSCIISYGIDKHSSLQFQHKTTHRIAADADKILNAFVQVKAVPCENAHTFTASRNPETCTFIGMKKTFQHHASKVGSDGLFVFHFSGHGINICNKIWGLAPMDFDYSIGTLITADVIGQWLNEVECKAKYVLITLDCCYAGGIGNELATKTEVKSDLYIFSACTGKETNIVLDSLGHSIFTYFLSECILRFSRNVGDLPMKEIFSECQTCCENLSSLLVSYSKGTGLQRQIMHPQLAVHDSKDKSMKKVVTVENFEGDHEVYNVTGVVSYLYPLRNVKNGPLYELQRRNWLSGMVLTSAFCCMMHSVASIELSHDAVLTKVKNVNLFINAFLEVAATIDVIHHGMKVDGFIFFQCLLFYKKVMSENKVEVEGMSQLEGKICQFYASRHRTGALQFEIGALIQNNDFSERGKL